MTVDESDKTTEKNKSKVREGRLKWYRDNTIQTNQHMQKSGKKILPIRYWKWQKDKSTNRRNFELMSGTKRENRSVELLNNTKINWKNSKKVPMKTYMNSLKTTIKKIPNGENARFRWNSWILFFRKSRSSTTDWFCNWVNAYKGKNIRMNELWKHNIERGRFKKGRIWINYIP